MHNRILLATHCGLAVNAYRNGTIKGEIMKAIALKVLLFVIASLMGCATSTESAIEQSLCTIEDQQAGTCTLRILTRDTARSQVPPGETIVNETYGVCTANICAVRIELPSVIITAACIKDDDGTVNCSSASCTRGESGCPG